MQPYLFPYEVDYRTPEHQLYGVDHGRQYSTGDQSKDHFAKILSHRVAFLKHVISDIEAQIQQRQQLSEHLQADIDEQTCRTRTEIVQLDSWQSEDRRDRHIALERQIAELYREKRAQEVGHWRDTASLRQELRGAEKELASAAVDLWLVRHLRH